MSRSGTFRTMAGLVPGMSLIVLLAAGLGLAFNTLSPNRLPLVRKPLRETRRFVTTSDLLTRSQSRPMQPANQKATDTIPAPSPNPIPEATKPAPVQSQKVTPPPGKTQTSATPTIPAKKPDAPKKVEALFTNLDDAKALFDKKTAIFIDGRAAVDYKAEHIPGSLSLFSGEIDSLYQKVLGRVPKDKFIVTYCSDPECTEAINLADALVAKGYTKVVILLEGLPGWKDAGYPTTKAGESE